MEDLLCARPRPLTKPIVSLAPQEGKVITYWAVLEHRQDYQGDAVQDGRGLGPALLVTADGCRGVGEGRPKEAKFMNFQGKGNWNFCKNLGGGNEKRRRPVWLERQGSSFPLGPRGW